MTCEKHAGARAGGGEEVRGGALRMKCIWALKNEAPVAGQRGWGGGGQRLPPGACVHVWARRRKN
jgi:hypothetical protein